MRLFHLLVSTLVQAQVSVEVAITVSYSDFSSAIAGGDAVDAAVTEGTFRDKLVKQGLSDVAGVTLVMPSTTPSVYTHCNAAADASSRGAILASLANLKACHTRNPADPTECTADETTTMLAEYPLIGAAKATCLAADSTSMGAGKSFSNSIFPLKAQKTMQWPTMLACNFIYNE